MTLCRQNEDTDNMKPSMVTFDVPNFFHSRTHQGAVTAHFPPMTMPTTMSRHFNTFGMGIPKRTIPRNTLVANQAKNESKESTEQNKTDLKPGEVPKIAKPKRPLTAYNIFFRAERARLTGESKNITGENNCGSGIVDSGKPEDEDPASGKARKRKAACNKGNNKKISFSAMARMIGQKWKRLDVSEKVKFEVEAAKDLKRYRSDMERYRQTLHVIGGRHHQVLQNCYGPPVATVDLTSSVRSIDVASGKLNNKTVSLEGCKDTIVKALQICEGGKQKKPAESTGDKEFAFVVHSCLPSDEHDLEESTTQMHQVCETLINGSDDLEKDLQATLAGDDTLTCTVQKEDMKINHSTPDPPTSGHNTLEPCPPILLESSQVSDLFDFEICNEDVAFTIENNLEEDAAFDPLQIFATFDDNFWEKAVCTKKQRCQ